MTNIQPYKYQTELFKIAVFIHWLSMSSSSEFISNWYYVLYYKKYAMFEILIEHYSMSLYYMLPSALELSPIIIDEQYGEMATAYSMHVMYFTCRFLLLLSMIAIGKYERALKKLCQSQNVLYKWRSLISRVFYILFPMHCTLDRPYSSLKSDKYASQYHKFE